MNRKQTTLMIFAVALVGVSVSYLLLTVFYHGGGGLAIQSDVSIVSYQQDFDNKSIEDQDISSTSEATMSVGAFSAELLGVKEAGEIFLSQPEMVSTTVDFVDEEVYETAPADFFLVTPAGETLGFDPRAGKGYDIDDGQYSEEIFLSDPLAEGVETPSNVAKRISASRLEAGEYRLYVVGTESGEYDLSGLVYDLNGRAHSYDFSFTTEAGAVDSYVFDLKTGEVEVIEDNPVSDCDSDAIESWIEERIGAVPELREQLNEFADVRYSREDNHNLGVIEIDGSRARSCGVLLTLTSREVDDEHFDELERRMYQSLLEAISGELLPSNAMVELNIDGRTVSAGPADGLGQGILAQILYDEQKETVRFITSSYRMEVGIIDDGGLGIRACPCQMSVQLFVSEEIAVSSLEDYMKR